MYNMSMKYLKQIAYVLLLVGGLNWGLYGVSGYDLVKIIFGSIPMIANIIYVLVGLSALYLIFSRFRLCVCTKCECSSNTCCSTCSKEPEQKTSEELKS